jgi:hypothetical protein
MRTCSKYSSTTRENSEHTRLSFHFHHAAAAACQYELTVRGEARSGVRRKEKAKPRKERTAAVVCTREWPLLLYPVKPLTSCTR